MMFIFYEFMFCLLLFFGCGKVCDNYVVGNDKFLIVMIDCLLVFDVVMGELILNKGCVLNQMVNFWFDKFVYIVLNYLMGDVLEVVVVVDEVEQVKGCGVVVKCFELIMIEVVVCGYLVGSGWKEYQVLGVVCGVQLLVGLQNVQKLLELIFMLVVKVEMGEYDENIMFEEIECCIGIELVVMICDILIKLYKEVVDYVVMCGIIIVDMKFEFGFDNYGKLYLMDEVLIVDLLCFWLVDQYEVGINLLLFDKQFVCDWFEVQLWGKMVLVLVLLVDVVEKMVVKYQEVFECIMGQLFV